jgi:FKBP-type peptidyl-prolyl cis-trans isomerase
MTTKLKSKIAMLLVAAASLCLTSCNDSGPDFADPNKQFQQDTLAIDEFLNNSGLQAERDPTGLRMVITKIGDGLPAHPQDSIDVDYVGKLFSNGSTFDQGNIKIPLSDVINGWRIAFAKLPEGSEATIYIPSYLGYGPSSSQSIPANSILVFTITRFKKMVTTQQRQKLAADTVAIDNYLTAQNIQNVFRDSTGLRYVITNATSGQTPTWFDRVSIKYSIKLLSNDTRIVFEDDILPSSGFYSRVIDYIHGMKVGLSKLSVGSKATLYIPSGLGYGTKDATNSSGTTVVPANSNLIVDIELKSIE